MLKFLSWIIIIITHLVICTSILILVVMLIMFQPLHPLHFFRYLHLSSVHFLEFWNKSFIHVCRLVSLHFLYLGDISHHLILTCFIHFLCLTISSTELEYWDFSAQLDSELPAAVTTHSTSTISWGQTFKFKVLEILH